jgi:hypothetical protein
MKQEELVTHGKKLYESVLLDAMRVTCFIVFLESKWEPITAKPYGSTLLDLTQMDWFGYFIKKIALLPTKNAHSHTN